MVGSPFTLLPLFLQVKVENIVKELKKGKTFFKNNKSGQVHLIIGNVSFEQEKLYENFKIQRVSASRIINSVAARRGKINELLITNY